jgi:hypothetical protein
MHDLAFQFDLFFDQLTLRVHIVLDKLIELNLSILVLVALDEKLVNNGLPVVRVNTTLLQEKVQLVPVDAARVVPVHLVELVAETL